MTNRSIPYHGTLILVLHIRKDLSYNRTHSTLYLYNYNKTNFWTANSRIDDKEIKETRFHLANVQLPVTAVLFVRSNRNFHGKPDRMKH